MWTRCRRRAARCGRSATSWHRQTDGERHPSTADRVAATLTRASAAWLGRDAFTNASAERPPNRFLAFALTEGGKPIRPQEALALVTSRPADAVRLDDRGRIAPGMRADLVRVRALDGAPHVRSVRREGRRVA